MKLLVVLPESEREKLLNLPESMLRELGIVSICAFEDLPENEQIDWKDSVTNPVCNEQTEP